jgi:hypothetical protein
MEIFRPPDLLKLKDPVPGHGIRNQGSQISAGDFQDNAGSEWVYLVEVHVFLRYKTK